MSEPVRLSDNEIKEFISKNYEWDLREGILICLGYAPDSHDWADPNSGNDFPFRVLTDFRTEIRAKKLIPTQIIDDLSGLYKLKRDDIIVFFFNHWPSSAERTHAIWAAYKKARQPKRIKGYSVLEQDMDKAFQETLLDEYKRNKKQYDINPTLLNKTKLYKRILKKHPEWQEKMSSLRRSGVKFGIEWAKKTSDLDDA